MNALQLEALAQQVAGRVATGHRIEDSFIEAKAEWPKDPQRAARRIAAHANEMRGEDIVWVIGVDEDAGTVPGASKEEQGEWYDGVRRFFDQEAPTLALSRVTYHGDTPIVALLFDTSTFPYVVTKGDNKGVFEREVPMREGTKTRSAKRSEIVRLFVPLTKSPEVVGEPLRASVMGDTLAESYRKSGGDDGLYEWSFDARLYLMQQEEGRSVYPKHTVAVAMRYRGNDYAVSRLFFTNDADDPHVTIPGGSLIIDGPGAVMLSGKAELPCPPDPIDGELALTFAFRAAVSGRVVTVSATLAFEGRENSYTGKIEPRGNGQRVRWSFDRMPPPLGPPVLTPPSTVVQARQ